MPLKLKGSSSGDVTLDVPAAAGTNTLTLPARTGNIITSADTGTVTGTMLASATVTQSNLASNVAGNGPAFSVCINNGGANQNISQSTFTKIKFDTVINQTTSSGFDTTNNYFNPQVAGWYQFNATAYIAGTSANVTLLAFYKGTTSSLSIDLQSQQVLTSTSQTSGLSGSHIVYLNGTTDAIAVYGYSNGTSPYILYGSTVSRFSGCLIRSA